MRVTRERRRDAGREPTVDISLALQSVAFTCIVSSAPQSILVRVIEEMVVLARSTGGPLLATQCSDSCPPFILLCIRGCLAHQPNSPNL